MKFIRRIIQFSKDIINFFLKRKIIINGDYKSFIYAQTKTKGYSDNKIIRSKIKAFQMVLNGKALYERDGVPFYREKLDYDFIELIERILKYKNKISILDYGGGFGSLYFKNKTKISKIKKIKWSIIEQKKIVTYARKNFKSQIVKFYSSLKIYAKHNKKDSCDLLLFSSVFQYLPEPFKILNLIFKLRPKNILFLKTPLTNKVEDRIAIQSNPKNLYNSNYPIHIFSKNNLYNFLINNCYKNIWYPEEFLWIDNIEHKNLLFQKII